MNVKTILITGDASSGHDAVLTLVSPGSNVYSTTRDFAGRYYRAGRLHANAKERNLPQRAASVLPKLCLPYPPQPIKIGDLP